MRETLAIPIFHNDEVYTEIEIDRPKPGVIADTQRIAENENQFSAILTFISGCTNAIIKQDGSEITDKIALKSLIGNMPYKSAELVTIQIMLLHNELDDAVEGLYTCPRCGNKIVSELIKENDEIISDTTDHIMALNINTMNEIEKTIYYEFSIPVEIKNSSTKEVLESITSIEMAFPTLNNCINAHKKNSKLDSMRLQFAIYVEALKRVNGYDIDNKYKNMYGISIFLNISDIKTDLVAITSLVNKYGIDKRVDKSCNNCGKQFKAIINTSNFFDSGLQLM